MQFLLRLRNKTRQALSRSMLGKLLLQVSLKPANGAIHVVCATRLDEEQFWSQSALGQSLLDFRSTPDLHFHIHFKNSAGLPSLYNQYITHHFRKDILLFIHDDVWFDTNDWQQSIRQGLAKFDVIGVAGNRRLAPEQPAWAFHSLNASGFQWDWSNLSGAVAHGINRSGHVQHYGLFPAECRALDGVLLAVRAHLLIASRTKFDERFSFHFYDLDFCRTASMNGLILGTWGIPITHQSGGNFGSESWLDSYKSYLQKWHQKPVQ